MQLRGTSLAPLLIALAVAACSGVSADFVKAGATKEQVRADNAACRAEAEAVVGREANITRDIRTGRSHTPSDAPRILEQTRDLATEARYDRIFAACMKARGYSLKT